MTKNPKKSRKPSQPDRFIEAARAAGCSEDEAVFDATLKEIGSHKPGAAMAKEQKTSEELTKLLHKGVEHFSVGRIPNPQWIKIVPADPAKEGANWKVAHSGPPGALADAIEQVMRELQKVYDLSPPER